MHDAGHFPGATAHSGHQGAHVLGGVTVAVSGEDEHAEHAGEGDVLSGWHHGVVEGVVGGRVGETGGLVLAKFVHFSERHHAAGLLRNGIRGTGPKPVGDGCTSQIIGHSFGHAALVLH